MPPQSNDFLFHHFNMCKDIGTILTTTKRDEIIIFKFVRIDHVVMYRDIS